MNRLINKIRTQFKKIDFEVHPKKERIIRKRMYIEGLRIETYRNYYLTEQIEARLVPILVLGIFIFSVIGLTKGFMIFPQVASLWVVDLLLMWWGTKKSKEINRRIHKETKQTEKLLDKLDISDKEYNRLPDDCQAWVYYTEQLVDQYNYDK